MSRGLGSVERELLDVLGAQRSELRPELWLALDRVFELGSAPRPRRVSVRRATASLTTKGLLERHYFYAQATRRAAKYCLEGSSAGIRRFIAVRIALTQQQIEEAAQLALDCEQHQAMLLASEETKDVSEYQREVKWLEWYERPAYDYAVVRSMTPGPIWLD